jgi:hypothetical protein
MSAGEDMEKEELLHTVGGNINQYSHYGERYGNSSIELPKTKHVFQDLSGTRHQ